MVDRYTKFVLTLIALALLTIAGKSFMSSATAQFFASCGSEQRPCFVKIVDFAQARPAGD